MATALKLLILFDLSGFRFHIFRSATVHQKQNSTRDFLTKANYKSDDVGDVQYAMVCNIVF